MKKWLLAVLGVAIIGTVSYLALQDAGGSSHPLSEYGMDEEDVYDTVAFLERTEFETDEMQAGVNAEVLTVSNGDHYMSYDMPKDWFYASVAPYYDTTHPCGDHNLVTCQGELVEEQFDVTVKDSDGNVVYDETVQSESNGFFGIWLPRNLDGSITITHGSSVAEGDIQTFSDSGTCFTDFQFD